MKKINQSVLWKWGLSYFCLLFIPVLSIFINYYTNEKSIKKEYENAFELTLNNLDTYLNNTVSDINGYYHYIMSDLTFKSIKNMESYSDVFYQNSYKFMNSLTLYQATNTSLNCVIYQSSLNYSFSPPHNLSAASLYDSLCASSSQLPGYGEWFSYLSADYNNDYLIQSYLNDTYQPCLTFAHTVAQTDNNYITIFIMTPLTELNPILQLLQDGMFFAIQTTDNQLYLLDNNGLTEPTADIFLDADGQLILPNDYQSITAPYAQNGFTCSLIYSNNVMANNLQSIRSNFVLTLMITLLLSIASAAFLLHNNYLPVSELLAKFDLESRDDDEFKSIGAAYENLRKEYHAARQTVQYQNQTLLNSRLLSLLKGRIHMQEIRKQNIPLPINLDSRIALIGFMLPLTDPQKIEEDDLHYFIVDNIFCELFEGYVFYHIEDGRFIYYLFDLKDGKFKDDSDGTDTSGNCSWLDFAINKVDFLCNFLNEKYDSPIVGVVSEPADSINDCNFLYRKVTEGFEFQNTYDAFSRSTQKLSDHILDIIEAELGQAVKGGDLKSALNASSRIFTAGRKLSLSDQKVLAFEAFVLVIDIFNDYISDIVCQMNALNYVTTLIQAKNTEELSFCFNEILTYICSEISRKWQSESQDIVFKIRTYIAENYDDQNLSVGSIADSLKRNPKYISRVFKENTGEGVLDYINRCRIIKAKELMHTNRYTLSEISETVGYANVQAFRRAFVKLTGEIPSKYIK